jgi:hypothetical protein
MTDHWDEQEQKESREEALRWENRDMDTTDWLRKVFQDCWHREVSADEAYEDLPFIKDTVEHKVLDICRRCWMRDISADEALDEYTDLL